MPSPISDVRPARPASSPRAGEARRSGEVAAAGDRPIPEDRVSISGPIGGEEAPPAGARERLEPEQEFEVRELQQTDARVRAHEAAHQAAGGGLAGGATFSYRVGPDGRQYAVSGEVPISVMGGRTPDEQIENARKVRQAALAPSDPSPQDLAVAASAAQMEAIARAQKARLAAASYRRHGASASLN